MEAYPLKWITDSIAVGYAPRSEHHLQVIHDAGIDVIVNLCAECYDLHEIEKESNFEVFYLPVADEGIPTLEELEKLVSWMKIQIDSRKKILVHCRYGIGRTGTVVLAYLIHAGYDFKKAKKMLSPTPSWPSNRDQIELVDRYIIKSKGVSIKENFANAKPNAMSTYFQRLKTVLEWDD